MDSNPPVHGSDLDVLKLVTDKLGLTPNLMRELTYASLVENVKNLAISLLVKPELVSPKISDAYFN